MIKRTRFVTFPRSGHTYLAKLLQERLGDELVYLEHHKDGRTLEDTPHANAQKTHDFELSVPVDPALCHVVQYRKFFPAALSWYALHNNNPKALDGFLYEKLWFYNGWLDKWVLQEVPNRLVVFYDDFVAAPQEWVDKVVKFITV